MTFVVNPPVFQNQPESQSKVSETPETEIKRESFLPKIDLSPVGLPSKGLSYPENAQIKYRPYVVGEIKAISQSKLSPQEQLKKVLDGISCNFNSLDITLNDFIYLSILRYISTLGTDKIEYNYHCGKCKKDGNVTLNIQKVVDFKEMEATKLPIKATIKNQECHFKPLTVGQYLKMLNTKETGDEIEFFALQVSNIPHEIASEMFYNASGFEAQVLERVMEYLDHGPKPIKFKCKNKVEDGQTCNHTLELSLEGGEGIILPFRGSSKSVEGAISFG